MGGNPPLGYEVRDRRLVINKDEAATVRHIFQRYVELGAAQPLVEDLRRTGYRTRQAHGRGGGVFTRGGLYHLLGNRMYIGKVVHRGAAHDGEHAPIISPELWDAAQALLERNRVPAPTRARLTEHSLFTGRIRDAHGRLMTPSHAIKAGKRYRYYVTHATHLASDQPPAARIAAHGLEALVLARLAEFFSSRHRIADLLGAAAADTVSRAWQLADRHASRLQESSARRSIVEALDLQLRLAPDHVAMDVQLTGLRTLLGVAAEHTTNDEHGSVTIVAPMLRVRQHKDVRLIVADSAGTGAGVINAPLVALLGEARSAYDAMLAAPDGTVIDLAKRMGQCRKRLAKLLRIAMLAPDIVQRCLAGIQPVTLTTAKLFASDLPTSWAEQRKLFSIA